MSLNFTEHEVIKIIAKLINVNPSLVKKEIFQNGGLATQIDGDISLYRADSLKIISKTRTTGFYSKIGERVDSDRSRGIFELWIDAPHRIKNNHKRESHIYENIDSKFKENLPMYYGNSCDEEQGIIFLEYLENNEDINEFDTKSSINFIASLHKFYYENEEQCNNMDIYIQSSDDFLESKSVYLKLIDCIQNHYTDYEKYLCDLKTFVNKIEDLFLEIVKYGRTFCHGDFCHANMIKNNGELKFFDWEAAGYFNPEFDVVTFLARSANTLSDKYIINVLGEYYNKNHNRNDKKDYQRSLLINLHLVFLYGYSWILSMFIEVENKDFVRFEMSKFIHLYDFLKNKDLEKLI